MANNLIIRKMALPTEDWKKVLTGAGLAILGAGVTYLSQNITNLDFGQYTYVIVPLVTVALNVIRKVVLHEPDNVIGSQSTDGK
jgi:hypothetical protein